MGMLNFRIPDETHKDLKVLAGRQDKKIRDLLVEIIQNGIRRTK